jgi:S-adenosylmethionine hydrolase
VPVGKNLLYIDSRGRLSIGTNQGNFSELFAVGAHALLEIAPKTR